MAKKATIRFLLFFVFSLAITAGSFGRTQLDRESTKTPEGSLTAGPPAHCVAGHRVGKISLGVNNNGTIGTGFWGVEWYLQPRDYFTGEYVPSCEYPKGSNTTYLYEGALWIGAVVGQDTLVSVGADGWQAVQEMFPDDESSAIIIKRSILDGDPDAVSEEDYIFNYADTFTQGVSNDYFGRPHKPLNIEITQSSYAWSYAYAEDFVLFDLGIKNIGTQTLNDVYMGIYVDGDVYYTGSGTGFQDDVCGFRQTVQMHYGPCVFMDSVNMAWIADNDGDLYTQKPLPNVTATSLLRVPISTPDISFNWWASNGSSALDFGPRMRPTPGDPFRDFGTGGLGTPEGDVNKYYIMRHREIDYDQIYTSIISPSNPVWLYPNQAIAHDLTDGFDTRYLLSFGPFDIAAGQTLPVTFAYVGGEYFHIDPNNLQNLPDNPEQYYANLNFSDLANNARWASWIYDNPGVDTDGDGYAGKFHVCYQDCTMIIDSTIDTTWYEGDGVGYASVDTFWYEGDGVPDFRGAAPPPAPKFWLEPKVGALHVRWNGLASETTPDLFWHKVDFEGYRVYLAQNCFAPSFSMVASYDLEDYYKYTFNQWSGQFELRNNPFTLEELRCLYGSGPDPCYDTTFDPNLYTSSNPFIHPIFPDSIFYFKPVALNPELCVTTPICKIYPDAEYPSTLDPNHAQPGELTDDGYFKYFEYEMTIENLLPEVLYYVNVTAFDFGNVLANVSPLETSVTEGPQSAYPLSQSVIIPTNEWINVYCAHPQLNNVPLAAGDIITAYDPDSVLCGIDTVRADGSFGFMPIYRDDPYSNIDEGAEPGDTITFEINGEEAFPEPPVIWTASADEFEVCTFATEYCVLIYLHEGWNLISWNVAYSDDIWPIVAQLGRCDCLDFILSFDREALTYDPHLPQFSTLDSVDYYHGYWFKLNREAPWPIEICGAKISELEYIPIYQGWNLVSYWPDRTLPVEEGFESILNYLEVALGYDYGGLTWIPGDTLFNTLRDLMQLFGYWARTFDDAMLLYPGWVGPIVSSEAKATLIAQDNMAPSRRWMSIYGSNITLDGKPLKNGATIDAYSEGGVHCGSGHYADGILKFTPVYGSDDIVKTTANYPKDGDPVTLYVNDTRVYPDIEWAGHGSRVNVDHLFSSTSTAILPDSYKLSQNYPNPFNPSTEISFSLPVAGQVKLEIYNVLGQRVTTLADGLFEAGEHVVLWDGKDISGSAVSSGIYLYRLQAGEFTETKKMMLLK